jgi:bifunctional non-homologous end joining protein LigD
MGRFLHSESFEEGDKLFEECGARGLEGVVAKHRASVYRSGRSVSWVKVKCPAWRAASRECGKLFGETA